MSFNREGFMITVENFIGNPNDKTLFPSTLAIFKERMREDPESVITDLGYRSRNNFKVSEDIPNVFLGRSNDVCEEKRNFVAKQGQQQKVSSRLQKISEVLGVAFTTVLREIGYGHFFVKPLII